MNHQEKFQQLDQYVQMKTSEDIKNFERTVWELAQTQDEDVLNRLIDYFDDDCQYPEVMWSLLHVIETYPDEIYIQVIIKKIDDDINKYFDFFKRIFLRILNSKKCYQLLKNNIKYSTSKKISVFLNNLEKETNLPEHKILIQELKQELI